MTFFYDFFKNFQAWISKNSKFLKISILLLETVILLSGVANLASGCECSNPCTFRDITLFESKFFGELRYKNFQNMKLQSRIEALSGYSQELRILPPNMTAQNLVVFQK